MRLFSLSLLALLSMTRAAAQDGVIERRFQRERERIKELGIEQITEFESFQRNAEGCDSNKLKATHKYKFDRSGNLVEAADHQGTGIKTTTYSRNEKGEYTAKDYLYFDVRGNLQAHEVWRLEFNTLGQLVKEQLVRDKEVLRTNVMEYDALGQRTSQISDSTYKWTMKYDGRGDLIEFREWRKTHAADFLCVSITTYQYENGRLTHEVTRAAATSDVWNDCAYRYNAANQLIETLEKRTLLKRLSNGNTESETTEFKTVNTNNRKGNVTRASIYIDRDTKPFKCRFFSYLIREN